MTVRYFLQMALWVQSHQFNHVIRFPRIRFHNIAEFSRIRTVLPEAVPHLLPKLLQKTTAISYSLRSKCVMVVYCR